MAASHGGPVAHHFDNIRQQQSTVRFGMWLFLVTEVLFFGGVLCAYTAYRIWFPKDFEAGSAVLNVGIASVNTFLLLTSSLTITLAIRAASVGNQSGLRRWILATFILGTVFLGLKSREYYLDYEEGLIPGVQAKADLNPGHGSLAEQMHDENRPIFEEKFLHALKEAKYDPEGVNLTRVQLFFMFYYSMTGLHVLHMIVGLGLLAWQYILAARGFFAYPDRYVYVEAMSLYWHFVDMVWMFLLPLLYLAGPHTSGQAIEQFKHAIGMGH